MGEEFRFIISLILTIHETVKSLHTADSLHGLMPLYSHDCINSEVSPVQRGILELVWAICSVLWEEGFS